MQKASEIMASGRGHSSVLLMGAPKTGKTSFTCSGSELAGPKVKSDKVVEANDVVLINIDAQGFLGAVDCGYNPRVIDLSGVQGFNALNTALAKAIMDIKPLAEKGEINVVGLDLGALASEVLAYAAGDTTVSAQKIINSDISFAGSDVNWQKVSAAGVQIYRAFRTLPCTVVANVHVKAVDNNPYKSKLSGAEIADQNLVKDALAVGGESAKLAADVTKGVITPWLHNASHIFARETIEENTGTVAKPQITTRYVTHTGGSKIYSVGNRRASVLPPTTDMSLRAMLDIINKM